MNADTAEEVWQLCNEKLQLKDMSVRNLIQKSNVKVICTTDDPMDSLEWHLRLKEDKTFQTKVLPAWRPDKAMNLEKEDYLNYLNRLEQVSGMGIHSFDELMEALRVRMDFFADAGCCVDDHGLEYVMYAPATKSEVNDIFQKRMAGETLTQTETEQFKTAFMLEMGRACHEKKWVMQLHYGCKRDNNRSAYDALGADTGYDCINNDTPAAELADFLNALACDGKLPKTILYSLNPIDNAVIGTILGCFQNSDAVGKIQQGSAWWFNDNKSGMEQQMTSLANLGLLANFVGMLTDSRSFLSYTRHEYFRRIMCNLIGKWVENGEYPMDEKRLAKIVRGIAYENAVQYFGFEE